MSWLKPVHYVLDVGINANKREYTNLVNKSSVLLLFGTNILYILCACALFFVVAVVVRFRCGRGR